MPTLSWHAGAAPAWRHNEISAVVKIHMFVNNYQNIQNPIDI